MNIKRAGRNGIRNIIALGLVSLFTDISSEMVFSIMPIFIIEELKASRAILGLIEGLGESANYIFRMFSGVLSDTLGRRKPIVLLGYAVSNFTKPLFSIAKVWSDALMIRLGDRIGKGVRTAPRDALISESISERMMGKGFGIHRTLDQIGAIAGPALTFTLLPLIGMRGIFWLSFIPGAVALLILALLVKEKRRSKTHISTVSLRRILNARFIFLLTIIAVFSLGAYNFSFILLKAQDLGVAETFIPIIYMVINITHTLIGIPSGILSDIIGKERVLMVGYLTFLLTSLLSIIAGGGLILSFIIAGIYGIYMGIGQTVQRALIPSYTTEEYRGTAYGLYYITVGAAYLASNVIFGTLWDMKGAAAAFTYSCVTSITAIALMGILVMKTLKTYK